MKGEFNKMISTQAKEIKKKLLQNKDLDYLLNTDLTIQRMDWEDSANDVRLPEGTDIEFISTDGVLGKLVTNQDSDKTHIILYFHGGGLTQGSSITHRKLTSNLVHSMNILVLIHDYPLALEYPYPAALDNFQIFFPISEISMRPSSHKKFIISI